MTMIIHRRDQPARLEKEAFVISDTEKATAIWEIYGCFRSNLKKINPKTEHLQFSSREAMEEWKRNNPDFWIIAETEEETQ